MPCLLVPSFQCVAIRKDPLGILGVGLHPLCSSSFKQFNPLLRIKQLGCERGCKVCVGETLQKVSLHKVDYPRLFPSDPVLPEPFSSTPASSIAGHRKQPPVHEYADLCLVIPAR